MRHGEYTPGHSKRTDDSSSGEVAGSRHGVRCSSDCTLATGLPPTPRGFRQRTTPLVERRRALDIDSYRRKTAHRTGRCEPDLGVHAASPVTPMTGGKHGFRGDLSRLRSAQKPAYGTPAYSRYVNRPAGRVVAAFAHQFGLSPDGATAISAALSATGLALLGTLAPTAWSGLAVALLLASGYVMDSVDGQLARLRGGGSVRGEWLDHTVDAFKTSSLHLVVAISWFRFPPTDDSRWLLVPLGFAVTACVTYFGFMLVPYLRQAGAAPAPGARAAENPLRKWLILPTDYGFVCWTFVLFAAQRAFLVVYVLLFVLSSAMLALALRKWRAELTEIDRSRSSVSAVSDPQ